MKIILHVGAQRTGTTTFQHYLGRHERDLEEDGVVVWRPDFTREGLFDGLIRGPEHINEEVQARGLLSAASIQDRLADLTAAGTKALVVSEENLLGSIRGNVTDRLLYPHVSFRLGRLMPAFVGYDLNVMMTIRSYDTHWTSMLTYLASRGEAVTSDAILTDLATQPIRWRHILSDIKVAMPEAYLAVFPFETMVRLPGAQLHAVLDRALTGRMETKGGWHNRSPEAAEILPVFEDAEQIAIADADGRWQPFSNEQRVLMRTAYAEDVDWLRRGADGLADYVDSPVVVPDPGGSE